jgi:hypothetical protein
MQRTEDKAVADRRSFLKLAGLGAVTAGAALASADKQAEAGEEKARASLYRETEHIRRYYELAR